MDRTQANINALRSLLDRLLDIDKKMSELKQDTEAISRNPQPEDREIYEELVDLTDHFRELSKVIGEKIINLL